MLKIVTKNVLRHSLMTLFLFALTVGFSSTSAYAENIRFNADDSVILNPERGLANYIRVESSSIGELAGLRRDNHTIAWGLIFLNGFSNNPVIPDSKIAEITDWLDAVRASKVKTVLRVLYHEVQSFDPPGATLETQRAHLQQLGDVALKPYQDIILAIQAGGIGAYGEWYYAPPELTTGPARKQLLDTMFESSADDTFVMVRLPHHKLQYESEGGNSDRVNRTAHYNDCLLSDELDTGTYLCTPEVDSCPSVSELQNKVINDSNSVPVGGETCNSNPRNDCAGALAGMELYGWTFVNTLWFENMRQKWETQGCFDEITKKLGYRFELVEAEVPDSIVAGSEFQVSVTLKNVGWASLYKERPVYIRMMDENDVELAAYMTDADARDWLAGGELHTFEASFIAPESLSTHFVSLSLWMPDGDVRHHGTPEYSVQMANTDVWNPATGENLLAAIVPVDVTMNCSTEIVVPDNQWRLLSLPCEAPGGTTIESLFSDDIRTGGDSAVYGTDWIVYTYDPEHPNGGSYVDPGIGGSLEPGQGFWFAQRTGGSVTLDLPANSQPPAPDSPVSEACRSDAGCLNLPLANAGSDRGNWHIMGNAIPSQITTAALGISTAKGVCQEASDGCNLSEASQQSIVSDIVWGYPDGVYVDFNEQLGIDPWQGFWVFENIGASSNSPVLHLPLGGAN